MAFEVVKIGPHTLYCGDARECLPLVGKVDAVVTDPPYGLGDSLHRPGFSNWSKLHGDGAPEWDKETSDALLPAIGLADESIVWGGQYYSLPPSRGWLVWNKIIRNFSSGVCELAWTSIAQPVRRFDYSHGQLATEGKSHPTQKPLPLMEWCLSFLPTSRTILDPFMGSGTTIVACQRTGRIGIGIEKERKYFDIACKRVEQAMNAEPLWNEPVRAEVQTEMFAGAI